jgi:hypothetical protein
MVAGAHSQALGMMFAAGATDYVSLNGDAVKRLDSFIAQQFSKYLPNCSHGSV